MRVPADMRRRVARPRAARRKKRRPARRVRAVLVRALRFALIAAGVLIFTSVLLVLPLRWVHPPTTAFMLKDDSGREPLLHAWVDWKNVGTAMPLAVVAAEDQRFADHFGIDFSSVIDSLDEARAGRRLRGASTITQQLVKNLYLSPTRSFWRKGVEAWLTLVTEALLPKQRILELYVNLVELGPGIYGVGAASARYYGKPPAALEDMEAALLAAVLPNPVRLRVDAPSPYVRERQAWILEQMRRLRREQWLLRVARGAAQAPGDDGVVVRG